MSKEPPAFQGETKVCNDCGWGVHAHLCPVARSEGPGLDAPSLDEGLLARALRATRHRITYVTTDGLTWATPDLEREEAAAIAAEYRRLAQEGETP